MLWYLSVENSESTPNDTHIEKELLSAGSREWILVVGPHLAMQPHVEDDENNSSTSFYLRRLLKEMVEWCIQKGIINQPDTIEKFRQLPYRESLAHAGNELQEYLVEGQQLQHCLAEVLGSTSQLTQVHQGLAHLPFRGYISTTYDTFIETMYEQIHQRKLPKFYTSSMYAAIKACQDEKQFMLKLYGDIDDPASIVFGHRLNKGLSSISEQDELYKLLSISKVVFLGFEETDPDFRYLTGLLGENQPSDLLTLPQIQAFARRHYMATKWYLWEDSSNKINVHTSHPFLANITVLPETGTHTFPTASTGTQKSRTSISVPRTQEMPSPTHPNQAPPLEIYTAYTQSDERFFLKIKDQLDILRIQNWDISCLGSEVERSTAWKRKDYLDTANLILLLVSTTFLKSKFCYCDQMKAAVRRHENDNRSCCVIPVLLHPIPLALLEKTPFGMLDFLPGKDKAISACKDQRMAYFKIMDYIVEKIQDMAYYI